MIDLDKARVAEIEKQMAFCFDSTEPRDQSFLSKLSVIEPQTVIPPASGKVVAFPIQKASSAEATLLARILQRTRYFK